MSDETIPNRMGDVGHYVRPIAGQTPDVGHGAWVAPGAFVLGRVRLGPHVGVWYGAVIRGDDDLIEIDRGSNVQDLTVIHADAGLPCRIGDSVTIGHRAVVTARPSAPAA